MELLREPYIAFSGESISSKAAFIPRKGLFHQPIPGGVKLKHLFEALALFIPAVVGDVAFGIFNGS